MIFQDLSNLYTKYNILKLIKIELMSKKLCHKMEVVCLIGVRLFLEKEKKMLRKGSLLKNFYDFIIFILYYT